MMREALFEESGRQEYCRFEGHFYYLLASALEERRHRKKLNESNLSIIWMKSKVAEMPKKKAVPLEENARIVAGTLKGEAEIRAGLGKRFKNADEFVEYLEKL